MDGWMDGWVDALMDGWMDGWIVDNCPPDQSISSQHVDIPTPHTKGASCPVQRLDSPIALWPGPDRPCSPTNIRTVAPDAQQKAE